MKVLSLLLFTTLVSGFNTSAFAENKDRWNLCQDNIEWRVQNNLPHSDHIEMSGKRVSTVLRYGVDNDKSFFINKSMVWPLLRTIPNNTHASLMRRYDWNILDAVIVNGRTLSGEKVESVKLDGVLSVESLFSNNIKLSRKYFPSTELPSLIEVYTIVNNGKNVLYIEIPKVTTQSYTESNKGVDGTYRIEFTSYGAGSYRLKPGEELHFGASITGYKTNETSLDISVKSELDKRKELVKELMDNLVFDSPDDVIDMMFAFSKIRACESIYETKGGPLHGPGGESYYAAIWANDQAEYINPYFPFTGYEYGNYSALNSFRHFSRFMNDQWKPIPSSIIAEGADIWNGAGDRGDAAMIAYGASRYALALGDKKTAEELWPLITWCLEYCKHKLNEDGVVASDTDELENRFESGDANLCTSSLYYDALISASYLAKELGKGRSIASDYINRSKQLRKNIETYFGNEVEGFETYSYYKGNDILRSWICIPLTVGIDERKDGTIKALFSNRLWTENGLLTQAGSSTFWDRSTLYALRGVYSVGETEKATEYLHKYSRTRLLGEHVPYAIEAWPEGNQRHLSAESGLYGRIITEGLLGIRPIGFRSFTLTPQMPSEWDYMSLKNIKAFGSDFDINIKRSKSGRIEVSIINGEKTKKYTITSGQTINVKL